jgi:hypothetical protein
MSQQQSERQHNQILIAQLYVELLKRQPDENGEQHYLQLMDEGYTIETIRQRMMNSNEYRKKQELAESIKKSSVKPLFHESIKKSSIKPLFHATQQQQNAKLPKTVLKKQQQMERRKHIRRLPTNKVTQQNMIMNSTFKIPDVKEFTELGENAKLLREFYFEYATMYKPQNNTYDDDTDNTLTVVITNWHRPERLRRCVESVVENDVQNIVISVAETDQTIVDTLRELVGKYPYLRIIATPYDVGCNWMWLSGVYMVTTPYVLVLHDDDILSPEFGETYHSIIKPQLKDETVGHVYWDGMIYDVKNDKVTDEYYRNAMGHEPITGLYPPEDFYEKYKSPKSVYPLSPVVQIFRTDIAKNTLKECELNLVGKPVFTWPRPTMILGNDVMLCLRNLQYCVENKKQTLYVNKALTCYGRWDESVSQMAIDKDESSTFQKGYVALRDYYRSHEKMNVNYPMCIHVMSFFKPRNESDLRRHQLAMDTWIRQYANKQMLFCPLFDTQLKRTSRDVGDKIPLPFIRDIFDYGCKCCLKEDIITFCNSDICMVDNIMRYAMPTVEKHGCTFSFRRDVHTLLNRRLRYDEIENETKWYVGMDFTTFTKEWWEDWRGITTDNLIGRPTWDWMMRFVMSYSVDKMYVITTPIKDLGKLIETPNVIYHEKHDSYAERPENYKFDKANIYCFVNMTYFLLRYYSRSQLTRFHQYIMNLDLILKYNAVYNDDKSKVVMSVYEELQSTREQNKS